MGKRLYVGSLPFSTTENELHTMFSAVGSVASAKLIMDRYTNQSKGFGFVEMTDDTTAQQAIQKLNGSQLGTRTITVSEARPMEERGPGAGRGNGGGYGGQRGGYGGGRNRY
ncbi:MAG: RNA-binding protein [Elusimicrobia bacterium]|nr:RNA-binding protein [Elusimicrobiota bacterium]